MGASTAGALLFAWCFQAADPLEEMLVTFGLTHQIFFAMAVGHWTVNCWEDWCTRPFLGQGLSSDSGGGLALFPLNLMCEPHQIMYIMYFLHHLFTLLAYLFSLS